MTDKVFKIISDFVKELNETYGDNNKHLRLYERLINKTMSRHTKPIKKHKEAFKKFCVDNREAITNKDINLLLTDRIQYSVTVYIDMKNILSLSDTDTSLIIWRHLLAISAFLDPAGKAKEILRSSVNSSNGEGKNESDFLSNIINKVDEHINPNANPMEAIASIMKSGVFTELIGGMNDGLSNGTLDIKKIMGTVQTMLGTINGNTDNNEFNPINMMNSILSGVNNKNGGADTSNMVNIINNLMNIPPTQSNKKMNEHKNDNVHEHETVHEHENVHKHENVHEHETVHEHENEHEHEHENENEHEHETVHEHEHENEQEKLKK